MNWNRWVFNIAMLMDTPPNPDGGGGGGGGAKPEPKVDPAPGGNVVLSQAQFDALMAKFNGTPAKVEPPPEPKDLAEKARLEREALEKKAGDTKSLQSALEFSIKAADWIKTNASLLPKGVEGIFAQADKENYADAIEKSSAIKAGIVSEFFAVQSNLDLLTPSQKTLLDEFVKLTKNVKQERAPAIFDTIFEPTFEMLKRIKKAEQIQKGHGDSNDTQSAHKQKMMALAKKTYLGEK